MKSIVKPSFYFSAYPLRVIKDQAAPERQPGSPYLRALLSGKSKPRVTRARVLPLVSAHSTKFKPTVSENGKLPKDIELTEKGWFKNYE